MKGNNKQIHMVTFLLVIAGGILWGVYGLTGWELSALNPSLAMVVYLLVGLAAVYEVATHKNCCKVCNAKSDNSSGSAPGQNMNMGGGDNQ